ncbi:site-2 protease family protein [Patescibacteria group bacterium]|nr:site-2 protease family protein [Patescibacteria group bacterium]
MQGIDILFAVVVLIMSVVIHEVSHGFTANLLGDPTAKYAGRLTLNPIKHLDPMGSVIFPLLLVVFHSPVIFGWAKPVPYNPYNLRNQKWGAGLVAVSGPLSNFLIAIFFGLLIRFSSSLSFLPFSFFDISSLIVVINLVLGVFNLVPIPPLDGSKVLFSFLPYNWHKVEIFMERYGIFALLVFIFFFLEFLFPIVEFLFRIITGMNF